MVVCYWTFWAGEAGTNLHWPSNIMFLKVTQLLFTLSLDKMLVMETGRPIIVVVPS